MAVCFGVTEYEWREYFKPILGNWKNYARYCALVADYERLKFMVSTGQPL